MSMTLTIGVRQLTLGAALTMLVLAHPACLSAAPAAPPILQPIELEDVTPAGLLAARANEDTLAGHNGYFCGLCEYVG